MQRVSALWQASPQKLVGAFVVLMLAAMLAVASGASFTATSANAGNVVAAGVMSIDDDLDGGAILNVSGLVPGASHAQSGQVTVTNTGDADGIFTLSKDNVVDSDGVNKLSEKVNVVITDLTAGAQVYSGTIGAMGARPAGTIPQGGSHTYRFTVTFPDGGKPADATSGDNLYQGDNLTVDYVWESVSN
jgi:spore coat-associated protein N